MIPKLPPNLPPTLVFACAGMYYCPGCSAFPLTVMHIHGCCGLAQPGPHVCQEVLSPYPVLPAPSIGSHAHQQQLQPNRTVPHSSAIRPTPSYRSYTCQGALQPDLAWPVPDWPCPKSQLSSARAYNTKRGPTREAFFHPYLVPIINHSEKEHNFTQQGLCRTHSGLLRSFLTEAWLGPKL